MVENSINPDPRLLAAITIAVLKYRAERRRPRPTPPPAPPPSSWVAEGRQRQHTAWHARRKA